MITPVHARMARVALGWSQVELKDRTGLSKTTLVRFEAGLGVHYNTARKLEDVFKKEGVIFVYEDDTRGPGVLLSKELSQRLSQPSESLPKKAPRKRLKETK